MSAMGIVTPSSIEWLPGAQTELSIETISATSSRSPWLAPWPISSAMVTRKCTSWGRSDPSRQIAWSAPRAAATPALPSRWRATM